MKICLVTYDLDPRSGWGRYSGDVIAGARAAGHTVHVVAVNGRGVSLAWAMLKAVFVSRTADIVYAIDGWPFGVLAWVATRAWRNQLIVGAIGTYTVAPLERPKTRRWVARAYRDADAVIAISRYTRDRLLEKVSDAEVSVITPGIPLDKWSVKHQVRDHAPYILSVGALKRRKGYHTLLEAFALARVQTPTLRWIIVGNQDDQGYVNQLRRRTVELGLADAVQFRRGVDDSQMRELYADARLFVLLSENHESHFEGFGIVFLEAAAAGLPVVGTTANGIADAVGPENGILVPQGDIQAAADAMILVLSDASRWHVMSEAGRRWAASHDLPTMWRVHEEVYRRLKA